MARRVLVTGAAGMLGSDVMRAGERAGHEMIGLAHADLDITDDRAVERAIADAYSKPGSLDAVVNCAAWTDVDGAQSRRADAYELNARGPDNLARTTARVRVPLIHVSSDYVFDGRAPLDGDGKPRPYVESDDTNPRSVYGESKRLGEMQVLAASRRHVVVRSAWLFGVDGRNFVATMLRLAGERDAVPVVTDQTGCPTWTGHLAPALLGLIERDVSGVVHLAGAGQTSWNGFAQEIFRQAEVDCRVQAATSEQMARPAPRPAWSVLASERDDVIPMPDWRDGLASYLAARAGMMRA